MQVYAALVAFVLVLLSSADDVPPTPVPVLKKHSYFNASIVSAQFFEVGLREIELEAFKDVTVEVINILANPVEKLRKGIFVNVSTHEVLFTQCNIAEIEPGTFQDLHPIDQRGIYMLSLSNNKLRTIKKGVFTNTKFRKLDIMRNELTYIEPGSFDGMVYLFEINLGYNPLERIDVGVFQNLSTPNGWVTLYFYNNKLNFVDPHAFENTTIYTLDLSHNLRLGQLDESYFKNTTIGTFLISFDEYS